MALSGLAEEARTPRPPVERALAGKAAEAQEAERGGAVAGRDRVVADLLAAGDQLLVVGGGGKKPPRSGSPKRSIVVSASSRAAANQRGSKVAS